MKVQRCKKKEIIREKLINTIKERSDEKDDINIEGLK